MSTSSLYGINKKYIGEELCKYSNSWLFSPIIWSVLADKYLRRVDGRIQNVIGLNGDKVWNKLNSIMNMCNNTPDRICWEMSNQQIFFTKDKECIVNSIHKFMEQNKEYDDHMLSKEHIVERFNDIANDILSLNENEHPYFVFKNTSCDDNVEYWFTKYNEETSKYVDKSLKDWDKSIAEFVVIEDGEIVKFIDNLNYTFVDRRGIAMSRLIVEEKHLNRLNELLRNSNTVRRMYNSICAERRADAELINEPYEEPDIVDVIRGIICAAGRYLKHCDETYFSLENSSTHGIDYSVHCKKMTREEFCEIVTMTFSALQCLEHNVTGNDSNEKECK